MFIMFLPVAAPIVLKDVHFLLIFLQFVWYCPQVSDLCFSSPPATNQRIALRCVNQSEIRIVNRQPIRDKYSLVSTNQKQVFTRYSQALARIPPLDWDCLAAAPTPTTPLSLELELHSGSSLNQSEMSISLNQPIRDQYQH